VIGIALISQRVRPTAFIRALLAFVSTIRRGHRRVHASLCVQCPDAESALLRFYFVLRRKARATRGFFAWFNNGSAASPMVRQLVRLLIRKLAFTGLILVGLPCWPTNRYEAASSFLPDEDRDMYSCPAIARCLIVARTSSRPGPWKIF